MRKSLILSALALASLAATPAMAAVDATPVAVMVDTKTAKINPASASGTMYVHGRAKCYTINANATASVGTVGVGMPVSHHTEMAPTTSAHFTAEGGATVTV